VVEGGEGMNAAGAIIFLLGLIAVFGSFGGTLRVNRGQFGISGTAGFVMICLGAVMMFV